MFKKLSLLVTVPVIIIFLSLTLTNCSKVVKKEEIKPALIKKTEKEFYNFKTTFKAKDHLATIAVIPENWPNDTENLLSHGSLVTELIEKGFRVIATNNLYGMLPFNGKLKDLDLKELKKRMGVDAIIIYKTSGDSINKAFFRLVDTQTSEILVANSVIMPKSIKDEILFKTIASEISETFRLKKFQTVENYDKQLDEKSFSKFYNFKTVPTPVISKKSIVILNSKWPEKDDILSFEKYNLLVSELMSRGLKIYEDNQLYNLFYESRSNKITQEDSDNDSTKIKANPVSLNPKSTFLNTISFSRIKEYIKEVDALLLYTIDSNFLKRYSSFLINLDDGNIISSSSLNIPSVSQVEKVLISLARDIANSVKTENPVIINDDFKKDNFISYDKSKQTILNENKIYQNSKTELKVKPAVIGGFKEYKKIVTRYGKGLKGVVSLSFIVNRYGGIKDIKVRNKKQISKKLKNAGIKVIRDLRYNPGKNFDDISVDVLVDLSVKFE